MDAFEQALNASGRKHQGIAPFLHKVDQPGQHHIIVSAASTMTTNLWELELLGFDALADLSPAIEDLVSRSLDRNLFFEPTFLRASFNRISGSQPMLMCLWETNAKRRRLMAFMPSAHSRLGIPARPVLRSLSNEYAPLGTPLINKAQADETCEILFNLLAAPALKLPCVLALQYLPTQSPTAKTIRKTVSMLGLPMQELEVINRATLVPGDQGTSYTRHAIGKKRHKEYNRLLRRLSNLGEVAFLSTRDKADVRNEFEAFLALEARGWKGKKGSALYSSKQITAFARQAVSNLAERGECEIHSLYLDKKLIAGLVCFGSQKNTMTWKTSFDPEFADYSPGVQIMLHATSAMVERPAFQFADSLAAPNHSMIDHLWRERMEIGTMIIGLTADSSKPTQSVTSAVLRRQKIRETAKFVIGKLRGKT